MCLRSFREVGSCHVLSANFRWFPRIDRTELKLLNHTGGDIRNAVRSLRLLEPRRGTGRFRLRVSEPLIPVMLSRLCTRRSVALSHSSLHGGTPAPRRGLMQTPRLFLEPFLTVELDPQYMCWPRRAVGSREGQSGALRALAPCKSGRGPSCPSL